MDYTFHFGDIWAARDKFLEGALFTLVPSAGAMAASLALTGQVDAVAGTGMTGNQIYAANPDAHVERKVILLRQPNGITMRANQWNLHQWVNTFVYFTKNDGELDALYQKWFHQPLPALPTF